MKIIKLLLTACIIVFASCSKEESFETDEALQKATQNKKVDCEIVKVSCGKPGGTATYTYQTNFVANNFIWTENNPHMNITTGNGTNTVTVQFDTDFEGGILNVSASGNNGYNCAEPIWIPKCSECTPPNYVMIEQKAGACKGDVFIFYADPNESTDEGTYQWSASHGATVISGQGTRQVRIQSPSSSGFSVSVTHINSCNNTSVNGLTLAEFSSSCDDGGGWGF